MDAWKAPERGDFMLFGYWASMWLKLNKESGLENPSPFDPVVELAHQIHHYKTGGK
jgi:hypothetical protein